MKPSASRRRRREFHVTPILLLTILGALATACGLYALLVALPAFSGRRRLVQNLSYPTLPTLPPKAAGGVGRALRLLPATRRMEPRRFRLLQLLAALTMLPVVAGPALVGGRPVPIGPVLILPPLAAALPQLWIRLQIGRRRRLLLRAYPDLLAHLVTQLKAGAPTNAAFASAPPALPEPLRQEVTELLVDLATAPFPAALRRFADRLDLEPIRHLVGAIEQGESVGISLLQVLEKEEAHALALARQVVRERIQISAVTLAAVTVILLVNGLMIWFTPVAFELWKLFRS
jgi:hypothetical protein